MALQAFGQPSSLNANSNLPRYDRQQQNKRKAHDAVLIHSDSESDDEPEPPPRASFPVHPLPPRPPVQNNIVASLGNIPPMMAVNAGYLSQMALLHDDLDEDAVGDIDTAPIFTEAVRQHAVEVNNLKGMAMGPYPFRQYGLLAGDVTASGADKTDPRIFYNVGAPSSTFICGSQGSGKSHSLSCLLENCLLRCDANVLSKPLTGIVFHYDTFVSDSGGSPCEAAYLSSNPNVEVRVLCAPTNIVKMRALYSHLPNVQVGELRLNESDLNTKRMMDLMAVNTAGQEGTRLYIQIISKVLRDMRMNEQHMGGGFNYSLFKSKMDQEVLTRDQLGPLKQRLDVLESFMNQDHAKAYTMTSMGNFKKKPKKKNQQNQQNQQIQQNQNNNGGGKRMKTRSSAQNDPQANGIPGQAPLQNAVAGVNQGVAQPQGVTYGPTIPVVQQPIPRFRQESIWTPKSGRLTIVDLSCPMVPADMACSLFNMCLSLFLEQGSSIGRVIALDEAHKYMGSGKESEALTSALETAIRVQRHIGARVIISTQEPTISPRLLDLCSVTIVHRFSSPEWLEVLKKHLAGASTWLSKNDEGADDGTQDHPVVVKPEEASTLASTDAYLGVKPIAAGGSELLTGLFRRIVSLRTGEALLFSPSAAIGVKTVTEEEEDEDQPGEERAGRKEIVRLGYGVLKVRVRKRVTQDGGQSIMAT